MLATGLTDELAAEMIDWLDEHKGPLLDRRTN